VWGRVLSKLFYAFSVILKPVSIRTYAVMGKWSIINIKLKSMPPKKTSTAKTSQAKNTEPALMELFIDEIRDIYWAEKHLVKTLPKMQKAATTDKLGKAFAAHLEETKVHVERLEQVFELLEQKPRAKKCEAMEGLLKEGAGIIEETEKGSATRDVGLILAAQKVEHYEIATYGCLAQLAKTMGHNEVAKLFVQTLNEEKGADEKLTAIAENDINYQASEEA
jgi:ferritin-like metal-binding protein YciE